MKYDGLEALRVSRRNPDKRFPNEEDPRFQDGLLFPSLNPRFQLSTPAKVFTIGSCFARNIEEALRDYDIEMPTSKFMVPESEWPHRPNGMLNEYNSGTISQRILSVVEGKKPPEDTIVETPDGFVDLLLPPAGVPVTFERAIARRREVESVYEELVSSDLVIITLGLVEAWFDEVNGLYLNRMPRAPNIKKQSGRYSLRRLDVFDSLSLLDQALGGLIGAGVDKILLTVSPVPLATTFSGKDVVVANSYSKSVLRVCAEQLSERYPEVDYFPSFELVSSGGLGSFNSDNIHVRDEVVRLATGHMLGAYFTDLAPRLEADQAAPADVHN